MEAFGKETTVFQKAAALIRPPVELVEIPYEGATLPGYCCQVGDSGRSRPTLVCTSGYDSTINKMYVAFAGALPRGYNVLLFDGPGQGRPLIEQGLVFRLDWENVVTPVVDFALTRPEVNPEKVVLLGWNFGGYLAPRAASGEHRLAACIANTGFWDLFEANKAGLSTLPRKTFDKLPDVDPSVLEPFMEKIRANPKLRWSIDQRNFWVHGVDSGGRIPAPVHFSSFTGLLEAQPHNTVHVKVGGWMGDPNTAAQHPIFWLHHANIDRLWEHWLDRGDDRANPPKLRRKPLSLRPSPQADRA